MAEREQVAVAVAETVAETVAERTKAVAEKMWQVAEKTRKVAEHIKTVTEKQRENENESAKESNSEEGRGSKSRRGRGGALGFYIFYRTRLLRVRVCVRDLVQVMLGREERRERAVSLGAFNWFPKGSKQGGDCDSPLHELDTENSLTIFCLSHNYGA